MEGLNGAQDTTLAHAARAACKHISCLSVHLRIWWSGRYQKIRSANGPIFKCHHSWCRWCVLWVSPYVFSSLSLPIFDLVRKTLSLPVAVGETYQNETLLHNGYLSCSPLMPTVAITIRSLSLFRQIHRTCPRFGIEAFSKALCHLHNVSPRFFLHYHANSIASIRFRFNLISKNNFRMPLTFT